MAKRRLGASFSARTALIGLEIRQDSCVQSPCLAKKSAPIQHSANFQTRHKSTCADLRQKFLLARKKTAGILTDFKIF
nr:hypothetical protein [uncultured Oscillibacter sp.]